MIDFRAHAEAAEEIHRRGQLRHHQIVDRPVHAARRRNPDLSDQDRIADRLDAPHQAGVDVKGVLVEHQVGFEFLDLGQQDCLGLRVEAGAEADLAGQWPQHRLQRRHGALQPGWKRGASARGGGPRRFDGHPVLARPCRLQPGIVDVDLRRRMAERGKSSANRNRRRRTGWRFAPPSGPRNRRFRALAGGDTASSGSAGSPH